LLFNSLDFAVFLPIVFIIYWFVASRNIKVQNFFILCASYVFYGWWDWRFLSLILFSTVIDYYIGLKLGSNSNATHRKVLLAASIFANLGLLGFFKYYNFFLQNFISAFSIFGKTISPNSLHIILPVGISFYTFQTLSYSIDVYRRKMEPTKDFLSFAAFVSFFPQLVAGPIERASNLLPQFVNGREFEYDKAIDGCMQILWGFFKKIVIADNCAIYANMIFNNSTEYSGSTLLLGALFFTFQIYGDFSGYSDIAIGISRLFGFSLVKNFAFPYFSRDMAEFWRRWHISLSTWFRDYLYIPLGGSRFGMARAVRNTVIIFAVSGLWHGSNWTFIIWGLLNAIFVIPLVLTQRNRKNLDIVAKGKLLPSIREAIGMLVTFSLTVLAWIFFRAESVTQAVKIIGEIFSSSFFTIQDFNARRKALDIIVLVIIFVIVEWFGREGEYAIERFYKKSKWIKWGQILTISLLIYWFGFFGQELEFIYFQF